MSEKRYSHKDRRPGNTGRRTASDRERLEARRKRKERNIQELKEEAASRVSYVRRPFAKRSLICLALTAAALLLGFLGMYESVAAMGQAAQRAAALAFCSMLLAGFALWYGLTSFLEQEKNYLLARIGTGLSAVLLLYWLAVIFAGIRG